VLLPLFAFLLPLQTAPAQTGAPAAPPVACPASAEPLPAELAGWKKREPLVAGAVLLTGKGADVTLRPVGDVNFLVAPEKAPAAGTYGAQLTFRIDKPGTIRIALGAPAWIDLVRDRKAQASVAHGHGPVCSGIRKIVDFKVEPGNYLLAISGSPLATTGVLVTDPK